uniref:UBX domain-containing protein 11 n=1 Tax=Sinocyclocheilus grahami TaxID=75366 RepID=A0A672KNN6_SINGR
EEKRNLFNENQDEELVKLCLKLQNQVWEMEKFLNDYGMVWVGSYEEHDKQASSHLPEATNARKSFRMNYDLVLQNIQELNIVAGEGESHVTAVPGGAKLTQQSSIPLWLYKNGIVMFSGPFRSYQDPRTQEFMQDLMDGFFPSELQERFPNGVPFQVWTVNECKKLSMEQFLRKLPETVVKEGKVISIRDSIKAHLLVSVVMFQSVPFRVPISFDRGPGAALYDIISAFPQRCYSDDTQTLLSCGLTPNAALLLRPQASSHRQCGDT